MTEFRIEIGNLFLPVMKEIVQGLSSFVKILTPAGTATDNYARTTRILVGSLLTLNTTLFIVGRSFAKLMLAYRQAASLTAGLTFKNWLLDDSYTLLSKGARRLGKAIAFLRTNMMALFLGITAVLSVVMIVANEFAKAREAAQKFVETTSIALPLQKEIFELEQKIQGLKDEGAKDNLIDIYENRLSQLREINAELDEANLKSFVQASGIDNVADIGPDTEAFDAFLKEQASLIKSGEKSMFMSRYAQMLEVDMDTAIAIAESGTSALIKTLARFEKQQIQILGNIATQDKGVAFNLFSQAFTRMGKKDMENIKEGLSGVVNEFNELDESIRGPETSLERIQASTTEWNRVLDILFDTSEDGASDIESVNEKVLELALGMEKASDATAVLVTDISQLGKLAFFSAREMIEGTEKVEERMLALNELVLLLAEQGFPALGKAALDKGPVEGIQMALNFLTMSNDMREREIDILVKSNSEYADYTNLQNEVVKKLTDNLSLTQGIATEQERINALLNVQREIATDRAQDELAAVKELFDMSQARISAEEKIADARENLANLTRDLVYDNITITQAQMMQVELNEAILDFQEAIREYGEEGVVTAHEELDILQKTLALDKMRDKLSATMTARERKRIRDKEKEVK